MNSLSFLSMAWLPALIGFVAVVAIMPLWIRFLKTKDANQQVSEYALAQFQQKAKTPTFGGFICVVVSAIGILIYSLIHQCLSSTMLLIVTLLLYGAIGFIDDYLIVMTHNNAGLSPRCKMAMQIAFATILVCSMYLHIDTKLYLFTFSFDLKLLYIPFMIFVFVGSSNAVNLTDGMDGLAAGCSTIAAFGFAIIAYVKQADPSLIFFLFLLIGSLLGYLVFNMHPAKIFMGDTGSLALGGIFAAIAMLLKEEVAYVIIGGVFVVETICCMLQIYWVKHFHKRLFIYTPIHYAFTKNGWKETSTVYLFWFFAIICMLLGVTVALFSF